MGKPFTHNFATTPTGEKVSYYTKGSGPNILVLNGAVTYALSFSELAEVLSPWFTVHTASRPGRGLSDGYPATVTDQATHLVTSPPAESLPAETGKGSTIKVGARTYNRTYRPEFTEAVLESERVVLNTLIAATEAQFLIGVSSGALVMLSSLLDQKASSSPPSPLASVKKIIVFEPPLYFSDHDSDGDLGGLPQFEEELMRGDTISALTTAVYVAQMGPQWIPRFLMKFLTSIMVPGQEKDRLKKLAAGEEDKGVSTMGALGALLRYDFAIAEGMIGPSTRFQALKAVGPKILLLSGAKSPSYLKQAMQILASNIVGSSGVVIEGCGHGVLCGKEMQGNPIKAIPAIREFFTDE